MTLGRTSIFIDGENLVMRYQDLVRSGRKPRPEVIHDLDIFVWHPDITTFAAFDILRVSYYASVIGDDEKVNAVKNKIASIVYGYRATQHVGTAQLFPCVFKKPARSQKTRNVDINIVIDILRSAYAHSVSRIFLLSGDGDYLPLISEVMRIGKQVHVAAFSSGLNPIIRHNVDEFIDLDRLFFQSEDEQSNKEAPSQNDAVAAKDEPLEHPTQQ